MVSATLTAAEAVDWAHLTDITIRDVTPQQFANATAENINSIPSTACIALDGTQFGALGTGTASGAQTSCSGLTSDCITEIIPNVFASMNTKCMASFSSIALAGASATAISYVSHTH